MVPRKEHVMMVTNAAQKWGVPQMIMHNLVKTESNWNPNAVNKKSGASGMFQFMPASAKSFGIDPFNVEQSANASAKYLAQMHDEFGNWPMAVAGYNAGPGNVKKYGGIPPFKETQAT
jgi:soluble lytic murein transglycosylase-like protein